MRPWTHRITFALLIIAVILVMIAMNLHRVWEFMEISIGVPVSDESYTLWKLYGLHYCAFLGFALCGYGLPIYRIPERVICFGMALLLLLDGLQDLFNLDTGPVAEWGPLALTVIISSLAYAFIRRIQRRKAKPTIPKPRQIIGFRK